MNTPPLISAMMEAAHDSVQSLRNGISNVKSEGFSSGFEHELISFSFAGREYLGKLVGRNRKLCLGFGKEQDKAIAARVFLDGHAKPLP